MTRKIAVEDCPWCYGTGLYQPVDGGLSRRCYRCKGTGLIYKKATLPEPPKEKP